MSQEPKKHTISLKKDAVSNFYVLVITFAENVSGTDEEVDKFFNSIDIIIEKKISNEFCVIIDFQEVEKINYVIAINNVNRIADIGVKYRDRMVKCGAFIKKESIVRLIEKYQLQRPPVVPTRLFCESMEQVWQFIREK